MRELRRYEETHPWISFEIGLDKPHLFKLWLLLGECKSKIEHISGVPLSPELNRQLHAVYLAKGVHATTAIEGNTLSETQVQKAIEGSLTVMPSQEYLAQEVRNMLRACNRIAERVLVRQNDKITPKLLKYFNRAVRHRLPRKSDCKCMPGEISSHPVVVGSVYRGAPREDCEYLIRTLCEWLEGPKLESKELDPIVVAIVKAVIAHLYVAWIHPYCDGNGRTARLLELTILLKAGVPSASVHLLSNHYNSTRDQYYLELAKTSRSGGDVVPFIQYAVQGLRDQLAEQISWIREQQIELAWNKYVADAFPSPPQSKHKRQRELVLGLGKRTVSIRELTVLTPTVARDYARVSPSTLSRDLSELVERGLIAYDDARKTVRAKSEQILGFLPQRKQQPISDESTTASRGRGRPRNSAKN